TQAELDEYRDLSLRIETIARELAELSGHVTPSNVQYQTKEAQLQEARTKRTEMERRLPGLVRPASPVGTAIASPVAPANDLAAQLAQLRSAHARVQVLTNKLAELRDEAKRLDIAEVDLAALTRDRTEIGAQLARLESMLDRKRRLKELCKNRAPITAIVQAASPASCDSRQFYRKLGMMVAGGFGGGLALAFLFELVLNRALRRPKDVENVLDVPLFVTVPALELT